MNELNDGALSLPQLPRDCTINNILTRVPGKSLARFRCVCKQWCNLFNDAFLINLHRYQQDVGSFIWCKKVTEDGTKYTYSLVCFDIRNKEEWIISFRPPQYRDINNSLILIEAHGDFFLLSIRKLNGALQYSLYNPITKASIPLRARYLGGPICVGYDSTTSKYKLVEPEIYVHNVSSSCCFVFDDHLKEWKPVYMPFHVEMVSNSQVRQYEKTTSYVFSNSTMHRICCGISPGKMLSLDVLTEIFSLINFPSEVTDLVDNYLLEMGGLLWFVHRLKAFNYRWKLWYLKKKSDDGLCDENNKWVEKGIIDLSGAERLLKGTLFSESFLILIDPTFKVFIKFVKADHTKQYIYSYDMDLKQWEFVYENDGAFVSYWNANRSVLEKQYIVSSK